jgi:hypothetical protein
MTVIYPTAAGDWSTRVWKVDADGSDYGTTPQPGDSVLSNGLIITIDVDIEVVSLSNRAGTTAINDGYFVTSGKRIVEADSYGGTSTCLFLTGNSGSIQIGDSNGSNSTNSRYGTFAAYGTIHIGDSYGGNGESRYGTWTSQGGCQIGNSYGSASSGPGTLCQIGGYQIGNSYGGSSNAAYGTVCQTGGYQIGNSYGGSGTNARGTYCNSGGYHIGNSFGGSASHAEGTWLGGGSFQIGNAVGGTESTAEGTAITNSSSFMIVGEVTDDIAPGVTAVSGTRFLLFGGLSLADIDGTGLVELSLGSPLEGIPKAYEHLWQPIFNPVMAPSNPARLGHNRPARALQKYNPRLIPDTSYLDLFQAGEQGFIVDPSKPHLMFGGGLTESQATPGTTVGIVLDESKGLELGPELLTNGDFSDGGTGWNTYGSTIWVFDGTSAERNASSGVAQIEQILSSIPPANSVVRLGVTILESHSGAGTTTLRIGGEALASLQYPPGDYVFYAAVNGSSAFRVTLNHGGAECKFTNLSVRTIAGNHLHQATSTSRPTYGRVPSNFDLRNNMRTTDTLSSWTKLRTTVTVNAGEAPDGSNDAILVTGNDTSNIKYVSTTANLLSAPNHVVSFYAKAGNHRYIQPIASSDAQTYANFDLVDGIIGTVGTKTTATMLDVGSGWYYITVAWGSTASATLTTMRIYMVNSLTATFASGHTTGGTPSIYVWHPQHEAGSVATNYQRVGINIHDIYEEGQKHVHYLWFDGTSDFLRTGITDMTATSEVSVFSAVRKGQDAARAMLLEFSVNAEANEGSFLIEAPSSTLTDYGFGIRGNAVGPTKYLSSTRAANNTHVLAANLAIAGPRVDSVKARVQFNDTQYDATGEADSGTGNLGNYSFYVGARFGSSIWFSGYLFALVVRDSTTDLSVIKRVEKTLKRATNAFVDY